MKSVCIVGAGPAGLVAAKTFLQQGQFTVSVFEATDRLGGMWRGRPGEYGDKCSPDMRTNLSRFTVAFSDLSWSSVDLSTPGAESLSHLTSPMFPKAWQVGRYLAAYAQKFGVDKEILYNKRITQARPSGDLKQWDITSIDSVTKQQSSHTYDYLIVASGFFDRPVQSFHSPSRVKSENYQHSSQFRTLLSLTNIPGKIVVIGGGISGSEAAAQAAFQVSSAQHSPNESKSVHANSKIYHIINRPFYCLPRYLPHYPGSQEPGPQSTPSFLPLDLLLYNLSRRGDGEITASITTVPPDKAEKGHQFLRSVIGSDQGDLGHSALVYQPDQTAFPGYTGITETYLEFVRSGVIVPVQGWVESVNEDDQGGFTIDVQPKAPWAKTPDKNDTLKIVSEVRGIIEATGYKTNLDYFDENVKRLLDYDPLCPRIPVLLSRGSVFSPKIPILGFVGFYEGPYWSVMEMQARLIMNTWMEQGRTNKMHALDDQIFQCGDAERLREALKARPLQVPQFWMADYVGLVEELARQTGVERNDSTLGTANGPAFPARYTSGDTHHEAMVVVDEVTNIIQAASANVKFVAAAVFRGMQGMWTLQRKIDTRKSTSHGGSFLGTAHFHPRVPTATAYSAEYLYVEEGKFTMEHGLSFPATRRYIYRYNEFTDQITAWFADDDGLSVGALFNTWKFERPYPPYVGWVAKGHHWCDPDTYKNVCEFAFEGATLRKFDITYEAEGPNKDYSHQSWYTRPETTP